MKAQIPAEFGMIIGGFIFVFIGAMFLNAPGTSGLGSQFLLYVGAGFILAGLAGIAGGILSLLRGGR